MRYDMADLAPPERYKLMVNTITPRPIAWVVTIDPEGRRNAAPYSFFNAMLSQPPLVVLGISPDGARPDASGGEDMKDTLRAIKETGEFTVSLVHEANLEAMNVTATNAPPGIDEVELAGIAVTPSVHVKPPFVATAPAAFECRLWQLIEPAPGAGIVLGEVIAMHIEDRLVGDENGRLRIDNPAMKLVGRTYGAGQYVRNSDTVQVDRKSWPLDGPLGD
jgi:flavin reductase (DIM6/NTAB) family NADH-FMN oxidoreductase RutF